MQRMTVIGLLSWLLILRRWIRFIRDLPRLPLGVTASLSPHFQATARSGAITSLFGLLSITTGVLSLRRRQSEHLSLVTIPRTWVAETRFECFLGRGDNTLHVIMTFSPAARLTGLWRSGLLSARS